MGFSIDSEKAGGSKDYWQEPYCELCWDASSGQWLWFSLPEYIGKSGGRCTDSEKLCEGDALLCSLMVNKLAYRYGVKGLRDNNTATGAHLEVGIKNQFHLSPGLSHFWSESWNTCICMLVEWRGWCGEAPCRIFFHSQYQCCDEKARVYEFESKHSICARCFRCPLR